MTLEEILKRLRRINSFLELSDEMIISYAGESARGYERAVKVGKTCADLSELIKELKVKGLCESSTVCIEQWKERTCQKSLRI